MPHDHSSRTEWSEGGLRKLLIRMENLSCQPEFQMQRQEALSLALRPYLDSPEASNSTPLPEEESLAQWFLFADFLPSNGQASLTEQVRDMITEHVPQEERVWLDPFRHSYMDLLTVRDFSPQPNGHRARLESLGDQQQYDVCLYATPAACPVGHVLLTRLPRRDSPTPLPGPPLVLSAAMGKTVMGLVQEMRRELEIQTGNFALSEWAEFAKMYGYVMLWSVARVRRGAWIDADRHLVYLNAQGEAFLYVLALYEHGDYPLLAAGLNNFEQLTAKEETGMKPEVSLHEGKTLVWIWRAPQDKMEGRLSTLARLTLTPTQLYVETDSPERMDTLKHQLAAIFGFSLHFRGEATAPPRHATPEVDLLSEDVTFPPITVSQEEEQRMLASFLDTVYLTWAETSSPVLDGHTPRHYCKAQQDANRVQHLLDRMEQDDLGRQRTGRPAYDYDVLRAHVGV